MKLIVPSPLSVTLPCAGLTSVGADTVSCTGVLSTSVSVPLTLMLFKGTFSGVAALSATATGMSLVPVTVTVKVLLLVRPAVSLTV